MKPKILEYEGKKYALVRDNEERECSRCALREKCHNQPGALCRDKMGLTGEEFLHHRLEALEDELLTEQKMCDEYQERTKTAGDRANDEDTDKE